MTTILIGLIAAIAINAISIFSRTTYNRLRIIIEINSVGSVVLDNAFTHIG